MRGLIRMTRGGFRGGEPVDFPPSELHRVRKRKRRLRVPDAPRKVERPSESLLGVGEGKLIARWSLRSLDGHRAQHRPWREVLRGSARCGDLDRVVLFRDAHVL